MDKHPIIGDVRGKGLMIGVELVRDRVTKERAITERNAVVQAMFHKGVLDPRRRPQCGPLLPADGHHQGSGRYDRHPLRRIPHADQQRQVAQRVQRTGAVTGDGEGIAGAASAEEGVTAAAVARTAMMK